MKISAKILLIAAVSLPTSLKADGANQNPVAFSQAKGEPIPFVPFKIEDFCRAYFNGVCDRYYSDPSQPFHDESVFQGTIGAYVEHLNIMEKLYNASGNTLRPEKPNADLEINQPYEVPTDAKELEKQLLALLDLNTEKVLENVLGLDPNAECPVLPMPGRDIEDPFFEFPRFSTAGILDLPIDDIIARFNEHQQVLCSLGMSLYDKLDKDKRYRPEDLIRELMAIRDQILNQLGLSEYSGAFSMESVQKIQAGIDIGKDILALIEARKVPSPEQLFELREKLNIVLPKDWNIPDIPNIPSPAPTVRTDLEVKKRKDWSGFNHGERDRFATYASAYVELRGSEEEQQVTAFGAAGIYILTREINAIGGYAQAFAGPRQVSLDIEAKAFGQHIFDPIKLSKTVNIEEKAPSAFGFELDKSYRQTFMVGPVPVSVALGARIDIGLGYEYGIYATQLKGTVTPLVTAEGYASGEAGIPGLLSVGAEAAIKVIDARIPLTGYAAVNFDPVGYPFLKMGIESKANYEVLKGRVYVFANYIVPRLGLPPVKKKRSEHEIFEWKGTKGEHLIMNWGLELGRNETKLTGDLLDQTDRTEAADLTNVIALDARREAVNDFQSDVQNKVSTIFQAVNRDLQSESNLQALKYDGLLEENIRNTNTQIVEYQRRLSTFFRQRAESL